MSPDECRDELKGKRSVALRWPFTTGSQDDICILMSRIKRGRVRTKKRRAVLRQTKGYEWGRKNLTRQAKTALKKAGVYAFRDRRAKKRVTRQLWQIRLNAALREQGLIYSQFINLLKKNKIALDRKVLSELAVKNSEVFKRIIEQIRIKTAI